VGQAGMSRESTENRNWPGRLLCTWRQTEH
jgi:hypothetical protein